MYTVRGRGDEDAMPMFDAEKKRCVKKVSIVEGIPTDGHVEPLHRSNAIIVFSIHLWIEFQVFLFQRTEELRFHVSTRHLQLLQVVFGRLILQIRI